MRKKCRHFIVFPLQFNLDRSINQSRQIDISYIKKKTCLKPETGDAFDFNLKII